MRIFALCSSELIYTLPLGFKEAGHEVRKSGPIFEDTLRKQISEFKPDLVISLGWTEDQYLQPQLAARNVLKDSGIPHIYWALEDSAFTEEFSIPYLERVQPDFVFSICEETVKDYKKIGIKAAHMDFGYSKLIHHPINQNEYKYDISIISNVYPGALINNKKYKRYQSIQTLVVPLLKEGIRVDVWGRDWDIIQRLDCCHIADEWLHGQIPYRDTHQIYNSSKIVIGLQNSDTELTQRTYEILASGGFLLTQNTAKVRDLFKIGKHLVASSSPEETVGIVKHYLKNSSERKRIATQAQEILTGNSYKDRAEYVIDVLKREGILDNSIK
jgi:spore maturation protein CgeB